MNAGLYFLEQVFVVVWKGLLLGMGLVGGCAFEGFGAVSAWVVGELFCLSL